MLQSGEVHTRLTRRLVTILFVPLCCSLQLGKYRSTGITNLFHKSVSRPGVLLKPESPLISSGAYLLDAGKRPISRRDGQRVSSRTMFLQDQEAQMLFTFSLLSERKIYLQQMVSVDEEASCFCGSSIVLTRQ
jgi:hypothetical protein